MAVIIIKELADITSFTTLYEEVELWLISDPIYGPQYGVRYYVTMRSKVKKLLPGTKVYIGICCNDLPGHAMEAIAAKVDRLYFKRSSPYWPKIESLCLNANIDIYDQDEFLTHANA